MALPASGPASSRDIGDFLARLSPDYRPTPLLDLPRAAERLGIAQVLAKDEGKRALGSFKSLGGTYAGLRALARHAGISPGQLIEAGARDLPALVCASDGNHGLAVAYAARIAGGSARIFLHAGVPAWRAERISGLGAEITWIDGTYDDTVDAAAEAAGREGLILISDTSNDPADPVVGDVMAGYGVIGAEIRAEIERLGSTTPTHLFVQAGVGGLAAALAAELGGWLAPPGLIVVAEPEGVACVAAALSSGDIPRLPGPHDTAAEMLSCGEASAPAMAILREWRARPVLVTETELTAAPGLLGELGGPPCTPSGATGFIGLMAAGRNRGEYALSETSRALIVVSETGVGGR